MSERLTLPLCRQTHPHTFLFSLFVSKDVEVGGAELEERSDVVNDDPTPGDPQQDTKVTAAAAEANSLAFKKPPETTSPL